MIAYAENRSAWVAVKDGIKKKWKQWEIWFSWAPESLQMVTAAMKLKDACSLEEKLWHT